MDVQGPVSSRPWPLRSSRGNPQLQLYGLHISYRRRRMFLSFDQLLKDLGAVRGKPRALTVIPLLKQEKVSFHPRICLLSAEIIV